MGLKNQHPERAAADSRLIVQLARLTENIAVTALCLKIQTPLVAWDMEKLDWTPSRRSGRLHAGGDDFLFVENLCKSPAVKGF